MKGKSSTILSINIAYTPSLSRGSVDASESSSNLIKFFCTPLSIVCGTSIPIGDADSTTLMKKIPRTRFGVVHATSEQESNGRHADTSDRKSHNQEHDHKNDYAVQVQHATEDREIKDNPGSHLAEDAIVTDAESAIQQHDIEEGEQALDHQKVTLEGRTSGSHNDGHGEQAIDDQIVRPGRPTPNDDIVGTKGTTTLDRNVHIQKSAFEERDSVDTSSINVNVMCNLSDPLFKFSISQLMDLTHGPSRLRVSMTNETLGWLDDADNCYSTQDIGTYNDEREDLESLDDRNTLMAIYEHLAQLRPEASHAFKKQRPNYLWEYVQERAHPLEHYRPSRSLTPYGAFENNSPDSSFRTCNELQSNAFQHLLCRKLCLLRPHSPELPSILVPCGIRWYLEHTHSLKMKLKKQSFDNIWSRWYCIHLAQFLMRRYHECPLWHGRMLPTHALQALDEFFVEKWTDPDRSKWPLDSAIMCQKLCDYLKSDPVEAIPSSTLKEAENQLFINFANTMENEHQITFGTRPVFDPSPGYIMLATVRLVLFVRRQCKSEYDICLTPCGDKGSLMVFKLTNCQTIFLNPEHGKDNKYIQKEKKAKKGKKMNTKRRVKIRKRRITFIQRNVPHRVKDERPEIAWDDPNHWTLGSPWGK